jgi:tetratricopeptide (TPR) repeat protein
MSARPDRAAALLARLDQLRAQGDDAAGLQVAEAAVAAGSRQLAVHFRLASLLLRAGRYAEADAVTTRAAQLAPATPAELVELGKRLAYFNRAAELRALVASRLRAPPWHAGAEADLGALLSMLGEQALAGALIDRAARSGVDPALLYNRSQLHLYAGRLDAAEADLRQALRMAPGMAKAQWALGKLPGPRTNRDDLAAVLRQLASVDPRGEDAVYLHFAAFARFDALDEVDAAWEHLARGNAAKRARLAYDPAAAARQMDALLALPAGRSAADAASPSGDGAGEAAVPLFIVGMHRSGTTLLERMLGNHAQVAEAGELYDFPAAMRLALGRHFPGPTDAEAALRADDIDWASVGRDYLGRIAWRAGDKAFLVDKLPSNLLNVGFIQRALPRARVVHMRRDPMDTCFSNLKELFSNAAPYSYDQQELADHFLAARRLAAHWQAIAPAQVLDVDYEALARDPRAEADRILAFCGLPWDPACLDIGGNARPVNTASSAQVREPIHTRGIGAWRRYERYLGPLRERLGA